MNFDSAPTEQHTQRNINRNCEYASIKNKIKKYYFNFKVSLDSDKKEMLTKTSMIFVLTFIILKSKILGSDINRYDNIDKVIGERHLCPKYF